MDNTTPGRPEYNRTESDAKNVEAFQRVFSAREKNLLKWDLGIHSQKRYMYFWACFNFNLNFDEFGLGGWNKRWIFPKTWWFGGLILNENKHWKDEILIFKFFENMLGESAYISNHTRIKGNLEKIWFF